MKKLIALFLLISSMFSFFILFNDYQVEVDSKIKKEEQNLEYKYMLTFPTKISNRQQEEVYSSLKKVLDEFTANIYYERIEESQTTKYVYATTLDYFNLFKLDEGKVYDKLELESEKFISTKETEDENQIGKISTLTYDRELRICTLKTMVDKGYLLDGYCTVSFIKDEDINKFISQLEKELDVSGIKIRQPQYKDIEKSNRDILIIGAIYLVVVLLVIYKLLKSYKEIGIERLLGFSPKDIYLKHISQISIIQIGTNLIAFLIMNLILVKEFNEYYFNFIFSFFKISIIQLIIIIGICSIPFIYIKMINISNVIKNKQPTQYIIIFNLFIKSIILILFIITLNSVVVNFGRIKIVFSNSFSQWEQLDSYAVLPSIKSGSVEMIDNPEFKKNQKEIYKYFNKKGSILADFKEYIPEIRSMHISESSNEYEYNVVTVNPNYLKKYPIYDLNNIQIDIVENEKDFILLIPEEYKSQEKEIEDYYEMLRSSYSDHISNQQIKIIWIKSNQKLFSMLIDINPNGGNYVISPIVQVITESNGALSDYDIIMGINGNPFKIKVNEVNNMNNEILEKFKEYGYDKNISNISKVDEQMASEIKNIKELIRNTVVEIIFLIICLIVVISQNIYNYIKQYNQHIAVRKLHGYSNIQNYFEYYIGNLITWVIVIIGVALTKFVDIEVLLIISIISICIEFIITSIMLNIQGKKKIVNIIKGAE